MLAEYGAWPCTIEQTLGSLTAEKDEVCVDEGHNFKKQAHWGKFCQAEEG